MSTVTLSQRTITILHNFASISPSITLKPGKKLDTINESFTVIASAQIEEDFPADFPILDVTKLLAILKLKSFKECQLDFQNNFITINGDKANLKFWASAKELVNIPSNELELGDISFQANVTADTLDEFIRVCNVLGHKTAQLVNKDGKTFLVGTSSELENSNDYKVELGETTLGDASLPLQVSNLKMLSGDYLIKVDATNNLAKFESSDATLVYFVGLEQE